MRQLPLPKLLKIRNVPNLAVSDENRLAFRHSPSRCAYEIELAGFAVQYRLNRLSSDREHVTHIDINHILLVF